MIVLVDSREQRPWDFPGMETRVATLKVGDYSVAGHSTAGVCIERKSFDDLFHTFTRRRANILKELDRMQAFSVAALVVECPPSALARGHPRTAVDGARLLGTVLFECAARGVAAVFASSRAEAQLCAREMLRAYAARWRTTSVKDDAMEGRARRAGINLFTARRPRG